MRAGFSGMIAPRTRTGNSRKMSMIAWTKMMLLAVNGLVPSLESRLR